MLKDPDAELISKAKQGDDRAFALLYRKYKNRVQGTVFSIARDPLLSEDLTQEAFLQLYLKIAQFRGESLFSTWFHRLIVNVVFMSLRRKRIPCVSIREQFGEAVSDGDGLNRTNLVFNIGAPDAYLNHALERIDLTKTINTLAPGYKAVFILHDVEGYDHKEIARILGCSVGASKSQLHKARQKILFALNPLGDLSDLERFLSDEKDP